jgi:aminopeptidase N
MDRWRKFTPALQGSMKAALEKVASTRKLSNDVAEVIGKSLSK